MNAEQTMREIHESIGRVSLAATRLQLVAAACAAGGLGHDWSWLAETLGKPGRGAQDALRELAATMPEGDLKQDLERFDADISECLEERNRIMHSIVIIFPSSGGPEFKSWHPKTDTHTPVHLQGMRALEKRMDAVAGRGGYLALVVQARRDAQDHADSVRTKGSSS